jgi:hypothetical protein
VPTMRTTIGRLPVQVRIGPHCGKTFRDQRDRIRFRSGSALNRLFRKLFRRTPTPTHPRRHTPCPPPSTDTPRSPLSFGEAP